MEDIGEFFLRLGDGVAGDGKETVAAADLQLQRGLSRAAAFLGSGALSDDAVELVGDGKVELYLHLVTGGMDKVIVTASPGFAPERPGNGVDDSRLAVAVIAGETGEMDTVELQRRYVITVAHEITQFQPDGYHYGFILA